MQRNGSAEHPEEARQIYERYEKAKQVILAETILLVLAIMAVYVVAYAKEAKGSGTEQTPKEAVKTIKQTPPQREKANSESAYPFNHVPEGWENDLTGFQSYTVPEEYAEDGGQFPEVMQQYTYTVCKQNNVDYSKVIALIEMESAYKWDAIGTSQDIGYMQIIQKWHWDRQDRLKCYNLLDPFQNISVGVDYLAELLDKYNGDYEKVFTAYQCGTTGAYRYYFSAGVNASPYAREVLQKADRIQAELEVADSDTH
jgi:soluble lytic murein transglycosylase-like protein